MRENSPLRHLFNQKLGFIGEPGFAAFCERVGQPERAAPIIKFNFITDARVRDVWGEPPDFASLPEFPAHVRMIEPADFDGPWPDDELLAAEPEDEPIIRPDPKDVSTRQGYHALHPDDKLDYLLARTAPLPPDIEEYILTETDQFDQWHAIGTGALSAASLQTIADRDEDLRMTALTMLNSPPT